jgi:hypothetical protein
LGAHRAVVDRRHRRVRQQPYARIGAESRQAGDDALGEERPRRVRDDAAAALRQHEMAEALFKRSAG